MRDLKLIVTIDTEEDDWSDYSRTAGSLRNIERIPALQRLFEDARVRPTYLVSYPVATDRSAASIFREIARGRCEVGTHCHPWNTPPFDEEIGKINSMLCNLPAELQYRKLVAIHEAIREAIDATPICFRAGRWGFDECVAESILRLGYRVDTSVTPFVDWTPDHGPDFSSWGPFPSRYPLEGDGSGGEKATLAEMPATIGFLQRDFRLAGRVDRFLRRSFLRRLGTIGLLDRARLLNKVWLSPEVSTASEMIQLTSVCREIGCQYVNMTFHSPSLVGGLTPFVRNREDERMFVGRIEEYLRFVHDEKIGSALLSDVLDPNAPGGGGDC